MKNHTSKKAQLYLDKSNRDLRHIFDKLKELELISEKLIPYLDPVIRNYCQVSNLLGNRLILLVANGSIATQLKFQSEDLLAKFKQDVCLQKIKEIHCKIKPMTSAPLQIKPAPAMQLLSAETAAMVHSIAQTLDDPKLRAIMEQIATRVKE